MAYLNGRNIMLVGLKGDPGDPSEIIIREALPETVDETSPDFIEYDSILYHKQKDGDIFSYVKIADVNYVNSQTSIRLPKNESYVRSNVFDVESEENEDIKKYAVYNAAYINDLVPFTSADSGKFVTVGSDGKLVAYEITVGGAY